MFIINEDLFIVESKKVIDNGFKLSKITILKKEKFKIILEYKKGNKNKLFELHSISELIIDHLNKIWRNQSIIIDKFDKIKVEISGWTFSNISIISVEQEIKKQRVQKKVVFEIELNASEENKKFRLIDYREPLELAVNNKTVFRGHISFIRLNIPDFKTYSVSCEDFLNFVNLFHINSSFSEGKEIVPDIYKFYCELLDFSYDLDSIKELHEDIREFFISLPIIGFEINQTINLGKCILSHKIPEISFLIKNPNFNKFDHYICLKLKNNSLFNAFKQAMSLIQNSINLINLRGKIPTFLEDYDYFVQNSIIRLGHIVYLKDVKYNKEYILNLPLSRPPNLEIRILVENFFRPIFGLENYYINPDRNLTDKEEKIMWMIYYLNSAESKVNENRIAAFIDLWIGFDFMLSLFYSKIERKFKKEEKKEIKKYCDQYTEVKNLELSELLSQGKISSEELNLKKIKYNEVKIRVLQLIEKLNEPSVNLMLEKTLEKYKIQLSPKEEEIYKNARDKRNIIIHGNKIPKISRKEYNIVSKIIYFIIKEELFKTEIIEKRKDIRFEHPLVPFMVRIFIDYVIKGLEEIYPTDSNLTNIKESINKLSDLGMPYDLKNIKNLDLRIPDEFDLILEKLLNFLKKNHSENEHLNLAMEYISNSSSYNEEDFHHVIRSILNSIINGLKEINPRIKNFQEAENILNQFDRLGFHSLNALQGMKGYERWKRREGLGKDKK